MRECEWGLATTKKVSVNNNKRKNRKVEEPEPRSTNSVPPQPKPTVVGIGASAGGFSALKKLFEHVPADSGLAFVVVVHLSPEHKSHLADLLQPSAHFPVQQVNENTPLEPNNVYVIPPNANLSAIDTHLRLSRLEEQRRERAPIDHFFRTLAATHDGHAIGVILTGTGSDGTLGLKEIKAKGGLIIVQDPNEAEFDGMPQSAIATGLVDRILPLAEIPDALVRYVQTQPRVPFVDHPKPDEITERVLLPKLFAILRTRTDRDFSRYKPATILRRIARRMQINYIEDFDRYLDKLREQPEEAGALADDLLITVTSFFRDPEVFERLEKKIIPALFNDRGPHEALRLWSVGCATGEEAYSLAMLLIEEAGRHETAPQMQIFASDLHKRSLDSAREGLFSGDIETDVSSERLRRFFVRENGGYRITKEVRDLVVFAPHNLLGDPPFSRINLISCRNLLIYLDRTVQRDVVDLFHYALAPDGYLLMGSSETVDASDLFRTEDKKICLYRKRNVPAPEPRLPVFPMSRMRTGPELLHKTDPLHAPVPYQTVHQNMLERYAPPSILVGPDDKLVHLSEHGGRYLVHPGGEVTASVLKLVREELRMELHALLQQARKERTAVDSTPLPVQFNGHPIPVVMHLRPAIDEDHEGFVLVIFNELPPQSSDENRTRPSHEAEMGEAAGRIAELESQLATAQHRLQAVIEEYETSREEMKAANEEMQSSNEELRSTMEELETSKEELQSINEELQTVNQENRHKVEELSQLTSDLQNLLAATDIATLFLDRDFRILRFTPRVAELFNVRVTDRGRPISDLTHRLGYKELRTDAATVLTRLVPVERELRDENGRWYFTRVLPYRGAADHIEGVVITFIDISTLKNAEEALRSSEEKLSTELESMQKLHDLVSRLMTKPDITDALQDILESAIDITQANMGNVQLAVGPEGTLQIVAQRGFRPEFLEHFRLVAQTTASACAEALRTKRRVIIEDVEAHPSYAPHLDAARRAGYRAVQSTPLISTSGRVIGVLSTHYSALHTFSERELRTLDLYSQQAADFVDRWMAVDDLRKSQERYRRALEIDTVGIAFFTSLGAITWANEAFLRFTGLNREQAQSGNVNWGTLLSEDSRLAHLGALEEFQATGRMGPQELEYSRNNGTRLVGLTAANKLNAEDGVLFVIDFTQRKRTEEALVESEREFNAIANVVPALLWRSEPDGRTTWFNRQWHDYVGQAAQDEEGFEWFNTIHPDEREAARSRYADAIKTGKVFRTEQRLLGSDGNYRWFLIQARPYFGDDGRLIWYFGAASDIDEECNGRESLGKSLAEKDELLQEIHHRVKNDLQVIISLLNLQARRISDPEALSVFHDARNRVHSIASIHDFLYGSESFSDVNFGEYVRKLVPDVLQIYGASEAIEVKIESNGFVLEMERAVPLGLLVNELVSNVCKHAFPDGKHGELTVRLNDPDSHLVVTVSDTGIGLPQNFDRNGGSTGLSLVQNLARQLDATVNFSSESNRGTTVEVRLPRIPSEEEQDTAE